MKITYPECQIEISTEEFIDLMNYFEDREPKVECQHKFGPLNYKKPEIHIPVISEEDQKEIDELIHKHFQESKLQLLRQTDPTRRGEGIEPLITKSPVPEFEPGGFVPDNEQPAPKPYPEAGEKVIPSTSEDEVFLSSAMRRFFESEEKRQQMEDKLTEQSRQRIVDCENTLEEAINGGDTKSMTGALAGLEDAWYQAEQDIAPTMPAPKPKAKGRPKHKKVDVMFETGWKTFDSVSEAAEALGVNYKTFYHNLTHGKPCKKHQVRYANPELDASLAEIKERDRQPYQPSKPIR